MTTESVIRTGWQVADTPSGVKYASLSKVCEELPAGEYYHTEDPNGVIWARKSVALSDNLFDLPGLPTQYVLDQIKKFWEGEEKYRHHGFLHKRGIMFWGPPGVGKTSLINLLKKQIVDMNGVIFTIGDDFETVVKGLKEFRKTEPNRPIMTVVEDLETYLESSNGSNVASEETEALALYDGENQINNVVHIATTNKPDAVAEALALYDAENQINNVVHIATTNKPDAVAEALALYDGENQINNVVHIATTNKPDAVADRFIRRPGRFDLVIGLHAPTDETRRAYLANTIKNVDAAKLDEIIDKTEGLSLAYLREIATTYLALDIPLDETIARLKKNKKEKFSNKSGYSVGFDAEFE